MPVHTSGPAESLIARRPAVGGAASGTSASPALRPSLRNIVQKLSAAAAADRADTVRRAEQLHEVAP